MKIKINMNISNFIFIIMLFLLLSSLFQLNIRNAFVDPLVVVTFFTIFLFSMINIILDKSNYSLNKTYWYFNLIFLFIAPFIQYVSNYQGWKYTLTDAHYLKTNFLIIFSNIIFTIFYGKKVKTKNINFEKLKNLKIDKFILPISLMCFLIMVMNVGFINLFSRATNNTMLSESKMFNTIFTHLLKAIPVYCFSYLYFKEKKINFKIVLVLLIILILNFPTSTTRFWMGAIFIGIFVIMLCDKQKNNRLYDSLIIFTFAVLFSLSFAFKYLDINTILTEGVKLKSMVEGYNSVDFDAYSYIARTFDYVRDYGIVYGKQLLGTLLFFVPRAFWNTKPIATGALIASAQGQSYTNVSCPFVAEGYMNFGLIGVLIFTIFLARICKNLDEKYWSNKFYLLNLIYPYFLGLLIFGLRGALHHAVVYTFCFCIPLIIIKIYKTFIRRNKI